MTALATSVTMVTAIVIGKNVIDINMSYRVVLFTWRMIKENMNIYLIIYKNI